MAAVPGPAPRSVRSLQALCEAALVAIPWGPAAVLAQLGPAWAARLWAAQERRLEEPLLQALALLGDAPESPLPRALRLRPSATAASLLRARPFPLRILVAAGCPHLENAGLAFLAGHAALTALDLSKCKALSDAGFRRLAALTGLQRLSLADTACAALDWLPALSRLQHLSLARTRPPEPAWAALPPLPALRVLLANGTLISPRAAPALARQPALELVDLTGAAAFAEPRALAVLLAAFPPGSGPRPALSLRRLVVSRGAESTEDVCARLESEEPAAQERLAAWLEPRPDLRLLVDAHLAPAVPLPLPAQTHPPQAAPAPPAAPALSALGLQLATVLRLRTARPPAAPAPEPPAGPPTCAPPDPFALPASSPRPSPARPAPTPARFPGLPFSVYAPRASPAAARRAGAGALQHDLSASSTPRAAARAAQELARRGAPAAAGGPEADAVLLVAEAAAGPKRAAAPAAPAPADPPLAAAAEVPAGSAPVRKRAPRWTAAEEAALLWEVESPQFAGYEQLLARHRAAFHPSRTAKALELHYYKNLRRTRKRGPLMLPDAAKRPRTPPASPFRPLPGSRPSRPSRAATGRPAPSPSSRASQLAQSTARAVPPPPAAAPGPAPPAARLPSPPAASPGHVPFVRSVAAPRPDDSTEEDASLTPRARARAAPSGKRAHALVTVLAAAEPPPKRRAARPLLPPRRRPAPAS